MVQMRATTARWTWRFGRPTWGTAARAAITARIRRYGNQALPRVARPVETAAPFVAAGAAASAAVSVALDVSTFGSLEQARGAHEQDDHDEDVAEEVGPAGGDVGAAERFSQA